MMIEGSEHFGLSQLYQFRGRVGRSDHQSYCFLFTDIQSATTHERMKAIVNAKSGFELAEIDLKLRGPGQFLGQEQTGLPDLAMKAIQNPLLVQKEHKSYNISHNKLIPLYLGVYEDGQGYKLSIQQNNKYKLEFKNIILSEGKWCRNTNELELKDINLRCSFYLLINNKKLVSKLLPGEYKSCSLIYK
jgi:hypothetical protein